MNSFGKVITVFLVIFAVLLVSLTAISVFFFQRETEQRKKVEEVLETTKDSESQLKQELEATREQIVVLEDKNKEYDERINSLYDELDVEEGIRDEMKKENLSLKEKITSLEEEKQKVEEKFKKKIESTKEKVVKLEEEVKIFKKNNEDLKKENETLRQRSSGQGQKEEEKTVKEEVKPDPDVNLEPIVISPEEEANVLAAIPEGVPKGRILSVDVETEFVIVNLGEKDGVKVHDIMSVYRGDEFLGDIRVTRVQPEMMAADLIPPFSSRLVRKNDQVRIQK